MESPEPVSLGALLLAARSARAENQQTVADAAAGLELGIDDSALSLWERDRRMPSLRQLAWLLDYYGATDQQRATAVRLAGQRL